MKEVQYIMTNLLSFSHMFFSDEIFKKRYHVTLFNNRSVLKHGIVSRSIRDIIIPFLRQPNCQCFGLF